MNAYPPAGFGPPPITKADEDQSDLLGILYYVYGALVGLGGVVFGGFALLPALLFTAASDPSYPSDAPPPWLLGGAMMLIFGGVALVILLKAGMMILTGRALRARRSHVLIYIGAVLALMNIPLGTALAIVTFMHMQKPAVRARFGAM